MIDDTCSINTGILNIISEVVPFCFAWPFTYHTQKKKSQAKHKEEG